jgi:hypothetical protein
MLQEHFIVRKSGATGKSRNTPGTASGENLTLTLHRLSFGKAH